MNSKRGTSALLRACGLDLYQWYAMVTRCGVSLRVRNGPESRPRVAPHDRYISACAEWRASLAARWFSPPVHLCVCGVGTRSSMGSVMSGGASPRVRSGRSRRSAGRWRVWCISACAEWATPSPTAATPSSVHLCVCGVGGVVRALLEPVDGASLRVRSVRCPARPRPVRLRCISACAEWTRTGTAGRIRSTVHLCACGSVSGRDLTGRRTTGTSLRVRS